MTKTSIENKITQDLDIELTYGNMLLFCHRIFGRLYCIFKRASLKHRKTWIRFKSTYYRIVFGSDVKLSWGIGNIIRLGWVINDHL